MMNVSARKDQVTVCKGNTCLTVVGELAKALAFVAVIGVTVWTVNEITKVFK
ncbi:hypothetical protein [Ohtaekwangia koreensis]|uniref:Uncharacterized protein n=1 Tax=Ohtaekwangia koreensis TaxID=688867 RepID=A0A1T5L8D1_9BACT|nr:hypothetical protein [Ohtaekwangia koreensis]SKC72272.1 hypothetical protein SAMN05660236_2746 [Ohtaekwangia koreensis]